MNAPTPTSNSAKSGQLGIEAELFKTADKLRGNMEPSDYKHVALGLIFLKYISDAFEAKHQALLAEAADSAEDKDEYLAENVFWVPKEARWSHLQANARQPNIGTLVDDAMRAIEKDNESLKGVLPKDYARPALNKVMLGELIDLISGIALNEQGHASRDILGRVYEYFLGQFAGAEGKRGGEFYTPRSVVRVLVEMLQPVPDPSRGVAGRVYDPCCGSGGMFVQSEKFVQEHGGRIGDIAIYGQESNYTTWRLCKMNLAVRGIDSDIRWNNEGSFHKDELRDLKADFILANPPFNISDWGGERLREDVRWRFGVPPVGNANYAWLQHIHHHLAPSGTAGVVLANGSMSSNQSGEGEIRKAMLEADVVDCMVALPGQLFYSTQIPACLWLLARNKNPGQGSRDRRGQVLFIDARKMGELVDRTRRELTDDDVQRIANTYHAWRADSPLPAGEGLGRADSPLPVGEGLGRADSPLPVGEGLGVREKLPPTLLQHARELRQRQTDAEQLMWSLLRDRRMAGAKFRRQHPLGGYILDFYCHEKKLAIELDGGQHNEAAVRAHDETRTAFLRENGIEVLRFWNHEVLREPEAVLERIWGSLTPSPSPTGRGVYEDIPGFCKSASLDEIRSHGYVLTPGRYVGAADVEDDGEPFDEKMLRLSALWREQRAEAARLDAAIEANLRGLGYAG